MISHVDIIESITNIAAQSAVILENKGMIPAGNSAHFYSSVLQAHNDSLKENICYFANQETMRTTGLFSPCPSFYRTMYMQSNLSLMLYASNLEALSQTFFFIKTVIAHFGIDQYPLYIICSPSPINAVWKPYTSDYKLIEVAETKRFSVVDQLLGDYINIVCFYNQKLVPVAEISYAVECNGRYFSDTFINPDIIEFLVNTLPDKFALSQYQQYKSVLRSVGLEYYDEAHSLELIKSIAACLSKQIFPSARGRGYIVKQLVYKLVFVTGGCASEIDWEKLFHERLASNKEKAINTLRNAVDKGTHVYNVILQKLSQNEEYNDSWKKEYGITHNYYDCVAKRQSPTELTQFLERDIFICIFGDEDDIQESVRKIYAEKYG